MKAQRGSTGVVNAMPQPLYPQERDPVPIGNHHKLSSVESNTQKVMLHDVCA
jgi:hypothetical protein